MKKKQHYVNNQEFLAALIKYKDEVAIAEARGLPKPKVNNYIGGCFLQNVKQHSFLNHLINYI